MATAYLYPQLAICKWAVTYTRSTINCFNCHADAAPS